MHNGAKKLLPCAGCCNDGESRFTFSNDPSKTGQELPPLATRDIFQKAKTVVRAKGACGAKMSGPMVSESFAAALAEVGRGSWTLGIADQQERRMYKKEAELDASKRKEVECMIEFAWGGCTEVKDCFDERYMDDGIITNYAVTCGECPNLKLSYWEARCGGNSFGWLLEVEADPRVLLHNCDTDITWAGSGIRQTKIHAAFVGAFRKARYGADDDDEEEEGASV
eukprot:CAMPEP_0181341992 /NCGR_PEP_ID=MMETSP1101-20121128/30751_1 /TAXON_ID=46948 /ORGANISM="Rhodomonas abbreviata, Strain Caron Lab Isolate" /LENGTH=224 /DNA_ID=CAMNT_0023453397 /DNA_START=209 /DNA_END=883 /DNA_ORIENTATION=-